MSLLLRGNSWRSIGEGADLRIWVPVGRGRLVSCMVARLLACSRRLPVNQSLYPSSALKRGFTCGAAALAGVVC